MSRHTPGPWLAELGSDGAFAIEADRKGVTGGLLVLASRNAHPLMAEQMHANARLIAAAPDLLDALQRIAAYPITRADELTIEGARGIARASLARAFQAELPAALDDASQCQHCYGKGWNDERKAVAGHHQGAEVFRIECAHCGGSGYAG